ncbi:MAG: cellulase family glycosylhydrolase [Oscillospiraceae bacterium]
MKLKKILAAAISGVMAITMLPFPAAVAEDAADTVTNITQLKYDFTLTGVTTETSLTFEVTTASSWTNVKKTIAVSGDGTYSVILTLNNVVGMRNMGYFDTVAGSGIQAKLDKLTVNGTYEVAYDKTLEIGSSSANGTNDIWGAGIAGTTIASGAHSYFKCNAAASKIEFFVQTRTEPGTGLTATNLLTASGDTLVSNTSEHDADAYNGYIQSNQDANLPAGEYVKLVYSLTGAATESTKVFDLQPYDVSWGGWTDNFVTVGDSFYNSTDKTYAAYVKISDIKASLTTGKALKGINLAFCAKEPVVTLLSYSALATPSTEVSPTAPKVLFKVTEAELTAAGLQTSDWSAASKFTLYVKITSGNSSSVLNAYARYGPDDTTTGVAVGKSSSKYLVGQYTTSGKTGNAIQKNLIGDAGTGKYAFPAINLNKSMQDTTKTWSDSYMSEVEIVVSAMSPDTDCELLGIVFNNGKTYPLGFTTPVVEAATYDVEKSTSKEMLKNALDYAQTMTAAKYTDASWQAFSEQRTAAQAVYDNASATDAQYGAAQAALHKVKAALEFLPAADSADALAFRELSGDQTVYEMAAGINLGNTLDGHSGFTPSETAWQGVVTTKVYIKALHDAGYNTVRIPVTWGTMINADYTINDNWMSRVQDIVDYCVSQDMYAIINIHHDGAEQSGWLRVASENIDQVYEKYEGVWRTIATRFRDYDEHLIFESLNEISCMEGDAKNSADAVTYDTPIIVNLNQIFVNTVRATGSNNTKRWLAVAAHYANNGTSSLFTLPTDSAGRIMFAAHMYKNSTNTTWTYSQAYEYVSGLKAMANKFNVPMYLGEYGTRTYTQTGTETGYNDAARAYLDMIVSRACQVAGVVPIAWDQGHGTDPYQTGLFTYWNRFTNQPIFKDIVDGIMRGVYLPATDAEQGYDLTDIPAQTTVVPITELTVSEESATMTIGDNKTIDATVLPADTNDVVLWSTDDDQVVTVSRGILRARGIGTTTVRAYSQSGSVVKTIAVTVKADSTAEKSAVSVSENTYTLLTGKYVFLDASVSDESGASLTYKSSNTAVATVSALGKVVGVKAGTAFVTVTSSAGTTKTVKVKVTDSLVSDSIDLTLNVLYNDSALKYYGNEHGETISVSGDGQYTLTFDVSKDLSAAGKTAGVSAIKNLTAVFIKDADIVGGTATASPVTSAEIRYDAITVNGQALTITKSDFKSALKSKIFDTNDPVNAWDGSAVSEAVSSDHVANFNGITNPTTISVTFTIQNLNFISETSDKTNAAKSMTAASAQRVVIPTVGTAADLSVLLNPTTTDSFVSFHSADASVASVDVTAQSADQTGTAAVRVTAMSMGTTEITAITENGLTVAFTVVVGEDENPDSSSDSDTESTSDSDTDSTSDSNTDSTSDSDTDSTSDSDTDSTSDSGTDSTSDSNTDSTSDSDTDSTGDSDSDNANGSDTDSDSDETTTPRTGMYTGFLLVIIAAGSVMILFSKKRSNPQEKWLNR